MVDARVIVVCPAENREYRNVVASMPLARRYPAHSTVEQVMRATLRDPQGIRVVATEDLIASLGASPHNGALRPWLDYHRLRYG